MLNHENPVALGWCGGLVPEPFAQIDYGNNFSAKVDHTFHVVGSVGHSGNFRHPDDLLQGSDGDTVGLTSHLKSDNMKFASHGFGPPYFALSTTSCSVTCS